MEHKPTAGQKFTKPSASFRGDEIDCVEDWKRRKGQSGKTPKTIPRNSTKVKVRNDTGGDLSRGEVVEFTGFLLDDITSEYIWLTGETPDLTNADWGVTIKPIPSGEIGEALVTGVCPALISFIDDSHRFARRIVGSTVFESADRGGAKIIFDPGGGSERECVIQIVDDTPMWYLGITREEFTQGVDDVFEVDVWTWDTFTETFRKVPGFVIEARDWFLNADEVVEKYTKVRVDWYISTWVVTAMYCSPIEPDDDYTTGSPSTGSPGEMEGGYGGESPGGGSAFDTSFSPEWDDLITLSNY